MIADGSLQVRLGYPPDAKLLILNADDLGLSHSTNAATLTAFDRKLVTSATAMLPCPWFPEVAAYARSHPDADLGLHLTLTSEWRDYRWGPVAGRALVPSLVGPDGYFYADAAAVVSHAKPEEIEVELRAQIARARSLGLEPTHLDAHMHVLYRSAELFGVFLKVARAYKLPIRMGRNDDLFRRWLGLTTPGEPIVDAIYSPGADVPAARWNDYYVKLIESLRPGVTEVFVHLAFDDEESRAVMGEHTDWGAAWRQREFDAMRSRAVRSAMERYHVILIGWRDIKGLM